MNGNIEEPLNGGRAIQVQLVAAVEGVHQLERVNCQQKFEDISKRHLLIKMF